MLKKIGLIFIAVLFALLVFPSVLARKATVERRVIIKSPPAAIYAILMDFKQFRTWDPWSVIEPTSTFKVEGEGVGSVYSWEGKEVGRGNMVIKGLKENESVDVVLTFEEPFPAQALTGWRLTDLGQGETEVTWHFEQDLSYFQRYFQLTMDGMLGADFEAGLARLKARMEGPTS
jgi:hypothetical protein